MKNMHFTLLPAMGPGEEDVSGTVVDLIKSIPYLIIKRIPPRVVINSVLKQGEVDAGMSGGSRWEPFELSEEEYNLVSDYFENRGLAKVVTPDWVRSQEDWMIWQMEVDHGVPAEEHRRLHRACAEIEVKLKQADKACDRDEAEKLHLRYLEASNKLVEFTEQYLTK